MGRRRKIKFVKRPGTLKALLRKHYGSKAFTKSGKVKASYVNKLYRDIKSGRIKIKNPKTRKIVFGKIIFYKNFVRGRR